MPPINLGTPPADYAWYTPSSLCIVHPQQSMQHTQGLVYALTQGATRPHTHVHKATTLRRARSLYNSTMLHTKTTRQGHIYVKKTVGEWWGIWGGRKWGWMFAKGTLSSDWRTLSKKLWATLLCHTTRRRRSSVVLSQHPNIVHMHTK